MKNTIFPSTTTCCRWLAGETSPGLSQPAATHGVTLRAARPAAGLQAVPASHCLQLSTQGLRVQGVWLCAVPKSRHPELANKNQCQTIAPRQPLQNACSAGFTFPPSIPPRDMQVLFPLPQEAVPPSSTQPRTSAGLLQGILQAKRSPAAARKPCSSSAFPWNKRGTSGK